MPNGPNNEAEAKVVVLAILIAHRLGVTKLHLERDSLVIVNAIICGSSLSWKSSHDIDMITSSLKFFEDFKISHILQGGNFEADRCANKALDLEVGVMKISVSD